MKIRGMTTYDRIVGRDGFLYELHGHSRTTHVHGQVIIAFRSAADRAAFQNEAERILRER